MLPAGAFLLVEFFDELVFGVWNAAWPLIRSDLGLSYVQVGLLLAVPHVFASMLEPPLGLLGDAWNRRALVRGGGLVFVASLCLVAVSQSFGMLMAALMLVFPASGAYVGLSQSSLMDLDPARHELDMARWVLAGSLGVAAGPLLLAGAAAGGFGWRGALVAAALVGLLSLVLVWRVPIGRAAAPPEGVGEARGHLRDAARDALHALRRFAVLRWLALIHVADLMLDVLFGFLALYYVDVVGLDGAGAALVVVLFTVSGLIGDALAIPLLRRVEGVVWVRVSAGATLLTYPAFLMANAPATKLALVVAVSMLTSGWYAVLKGRLYREMPGRSATVMALDSVSGVLGGLLPFGVSLVAQAAGLPAAMWLLVAGPVVLLLGLPRK